MALKIVDLSLPLDSRYTHRTPEGVKNVQLNFELLKDYPGGNGQLVHAVHMRLHHGTHTDAPMHSVRGGRSIDTFPLTTFYGDAVLADLTFVGRGEPIRPEDLQKALGGRSITGTRVLMRTDWNNEHFGQPDYEEGSPYIARETVDWVVEQKPLLVSYDYMHGKESPGAPDGYSVKTFTTNEIITMGYVRHLDQIDPARPVTVAAFPLAFVGVESSPVRAVAIQDQ